MKNSLIRKAARLVAAGLLLFPLVGCSLREYGLSWEPEEDTWVSEEGKSLDQLQEDRADCRRDAMMNTAPRQIGGGPGGDMMDQPEYNKVVRQVFQDCLRAKGWVRK